MHGTTSLLLALALLDPAACWSRLDVGGGTDKKGKPLTDKKGIPVKFTCGGAIMTEDIKKNIRGENPAVPVSIIARYPMLDPFVKFLSDFHVYCAIAVFVLTTINMLRPKGTEAKYKDWHMKVGRIVSYGLSPHFVLVGAVLNYNAIMLPLEDWRLAPPASDWRLQISYIIPFALNTLVAMAMGFFLCRYKFMPQKMATPLKWISAFSVLFWFTVGVYQTGSQAFGLGLGAFGLDASKAVPGGTPDGKAQVFFTDINLIVLAVGTMQAGQDFVAYKCLSAVEKSGLNELAWKDLHKWAMLDLAYQAGVIFALFLSLFPYCLYGYPDWTCISSPFFAAPLITVFLTPVLPHAGWIYKFIAALCGKPGALKDFCKGSHKWDTRKQD